MKKSFYIHGALLFLILMFASYIYLQATGHCGCGARVRTFSRSSGHHSSSYRSHWTRGGYRSSSDENLPVLGLIVSFIAWILLVFFKKLLRWCGCWDTSRCTHPFADHLLTWTDRLIMMLFAGGVLFIVHATADTVVITVISLVMYWFIEYYEL